ncbi:MAG: hypothetical protein Q8R67_08075 [Rhodoferax sp.]|nr:hypothetical protein [Rhodoferax sp.]MDP3651625.1 hypothetical protein [Rhodoferax sp.]
MAIQDIWLLNLRNLVASEGGGRVGIRAVADLSGLSEEYVYQLVAGKPNKHGAPREVGPAAARKITAAFSQGRAKDWFDTPNGVTTDNSPPISPQSQPLAPANTAQAATKKVATPIDQIMADLAQYLMEMDDDARHSAADVLRNLTHKPENHARAAAMFTTAFQLGARKVA